MFSSTEKEFVHEFLSVSNEESALIGSDDDDEDFVPESLRGFLREADMKLKAEQADIMNFDTEPRRPKAVPPVDAAPSGFEDEDDDDDILFHIMETETDADLRNDLLDGLKPSTKKSTEISFASPSLSDAPAGGSNPAVNLTESEARKMAMGDYMSPRDPSMDFVSPNITCRDSSRDRTPLSRNTAVNLGSKMENAAKEPEGFEVSMHRQTKSKGQYSSSSTSKQHTTPSPTPKTSHTPTIKGSPPGGGGSMVKNNPRTGQEPPSNYGTPDSRKKKKNFVQQFVTGPLRINSAKVAPSPSPQKTPAKNEATPKSKQVGRSLSTSITTQGGTTTTTTSISSTATATSDTQKKTASSSSLDRLLRGTKSSQAKHSSVRAGGQSSGSPKRNQGESDNTSSRTPQTHHTSQVDPSQYRTTSEGSPPPPIAVPSGENVFSDRPSATSNKALAKDTQREMMEKWKEDKREKEKKMQLLIHKSPQKTTTTLKSRPVALPAPPSGEDSTTPERFKHMPQSPPHPPSMTNSPQKSPPPPNAHLSQPPTQPRAPAQRQPKVQPKTQPQPKAQTQSPPNTQPHPTIQPPPPKAQTQTKPQQTTQPRPQKVQTNPEPQRQSKAQFRSNVQSQPSLSDPSAPSPRRNEGGISIKNNAPTPRIRDKVPEVIVEVNKTQPQIHQEASEPHQDRKGTKDPPMDQPRLSNAAPDPPDGIDNKKLPIEVSVPRESLMPPGEIIVSPRKQCSTTKSGGQQGIDPVAVRTSQVSASATQSRRAGLDTQETRTTTNHTNDVSSPRDVLGTNGKNAAGGDPPPVSTPTKSSRSERGSRSITTSGRSATTPSKSNTTSTSVATAVSSKQEKVTRKTSSTQVRTTQTTSQQSSNRNVTVSPKQLEPDTVVPLNGRQRVTRTTTQQQQQQQQQQNLMTSNTTSASSVVTKVTTNNESIRSADRTIFPGFTATYSETVCEDPVSVADGVKANQNQTNPTIKKEEGRHRVETSLPINKAPPTEAVPTARKTTAGSSQKQISSDGKKATTTARKSAPVVSQKPSAASGDKLTTTAQRKTTSGSNLAVNAVNKKNCSKVKKQGPSISSRLLQGTLSSKSKTDHKPPGVDSGASVDTSSSATHLSNRLLAGTAASEARRAKAKSTLKTTTKSAAAAKAATTTKTTMTNAAVTTKTSKTKTATSNRSSRNVPSRLMQGTASSQLKASVRSSGVSSSAAASSRESVQERVRLRIELQKQKQQEKNDRVRIRVEKQKQIQEEKRAYIQSALNRARAKKDAIETQERERQKKFQKTVPRAPEFATDARLRRKEKPPPTKEITLASSDDLLKREFRGDHLPDTSVPKQPKRSTLTVPQGPKLATSARFGDKTVAVPHIDKRDKDEWKGGLRDSSPFEKQQPHCASAALTVPQSPKFHEIIKRETPKSTAEKEQEMIEYFNSHPFKARPVRMNAATSHPVKPVEKRQLTTFEPFNLRTEDRAAHTPKQPSLGDDDNQSDHQFHALPMPDFSKISTPITGATPKSTKHLTVPEPFHLRTTERHSSNTSQSSGHEERPSEFVSFRARPMPRYSGDDGLVIHRDPNRLTSWKKNHTMPDKSEENPKSFKARKMPDFRKIRQVERESTKFKARPMPDFAKPTIPVSPRIRPQKPSPENISESTQNESKFRARPMPEFSKKNPIPVRQRDPGRLRSPESKSPERRKAENSSVQFKARPMPDFSHPPSTKVTPRSKSTATEQQGSAPEGNGKTSENMRSPSRPKDNVNAVPSGIAKSPSNQRAAQRATNNTNNRGRTRTNTAHDNSKDRGRPGQSSSKKVPVSGDLGMFCGMMSPMSNLTVDTGLVSPPERPGGLQNARDSLPRVGAHFQTSSVDKSVSILNLSESSESNLMQVPVQSQRTREGSRRRDPDASQESSIETSDAAKDPPVQTQSGHSRDRNLQEALDVEEEFRRFEAARRASAETNEREQETIRKAQELQRAADHELSFMGGRSPPRRVRGWNP